VSDSGVRDYGVGCSRIPPGPGSSLEATERRKEKDHVVRPAGHGAFSSYPDMPGMVVFSGGMLENSGDVIRLLTGGVV
jgi:hypothetical protein